MSLSYTKNSDEGRERVTNGIKLIIAIFKKMKSTNRCDCFFIYVKFIFKLKVIG